MIIVFLKDLLKIISKACDLLRDFIHKNSGIFSVSFLLIFFLEQVLLIFCVYQFFNVSQMAQFIIGVFALIVITTATLEKFFLEKKYQYLQKEAHIMAYENEKLFLDFKKILDAHENLNKKYEQLSNKLKK